MAGREDHYQITGQDEQHEQDAFDERDEVKPVDSTNRLTRPRNTDGTESEDDNDKRVDDDAPGNFVDREEGEIPEPNEPG